MKRVSADPKVKKTLVRHSDQNLTKTKQIVVRDASAGSSRLAVRNPASKQQLAHPTLCSSEVLANYLSEAKTSAPPRTLTDEINIDKFTLSAKVTRNLNFHFNDRIYNNLVELNLDAADLKIKDRKMKISTSKRDLEPSIDDFCDSENERDVKPNIPVLKPKMKPVTNFESGKLHKLVSSFEAL